MMKLATLLLLLSCAWSPVRAHDAQMEMATAARQWLASLDAAQQKQATFDFNDAERSNWHFVPRARKGLAMKDMTPTQRLLANALMASGLSHKGYTKAVSIMSLESILAEMEKNRVGGPVRDPELYYVSIFGTPGGREPWGWRVEGHHLCLNYSLVGDHSPAMSPAFFGTNPGEVREGSRKGIRVLANEEELARTLVVSLNEKQRKAAILATEVPKEVFNDPKRVDPTQAEGIAFDELSKEQSGQLVRLIEEYLHRHRPDVAAQDWEKIRAGGLEKLKFLWIGGLERGQPHYYRVQGGTFVLEYDNTQNDANHVHSLWRDFAHDFGRDLLKAHHDQDHAAQNEGPGK